MKIIITSFLAIFLFTIEGQSQKLTLEGNVFNESKEPIEYVNIFISGTSTGTLSDAKGFFQIEFSKDDTIIISAIGYEEMEILSTHKDQEFYLKEKLYQLDEVFVYSGTPYLEELGFIPSDIDKRKVEGITHGLIYNDKGVLNIEAQAAIYIENPSSNTGLLQSVSFFIHKLGKPNTPFRIRILTKGEDGMPDKNLLQKSLIVTPNKKNDWFTIDLKTYNISFPQNGIFISMEWLQTNNEKYWYKERWTKIYKSRKKELKKKGYKRKKFLGYGQILGIYYTSEKGMGWHSNIRDGWTKQERNSQLMIKAKVKLWK